MKYTASWTIEVEAETYHDAIVKAIQAGGQGRVLKATLTVLPKKKGKLMTELQGRLQVVRRYILYLRRRLAAQEAQENDLVTEIVLQAVANESENDTSNQDEVDHGD